MLSDACIDAAPAIPLAASRRWTSLHVVEEE
jgi:hypothetical protein